MALDCENRDFPPDGLVSHYRKKTFFPDDCHRSDKLVRVLQRRLALIIGPEDGQP